MDQTVNYLSGKVEMAVGQLTVGAEFLGDVTATFREGTSSTDSQAGTITRPNGRIETAQVEGQFILPSMDALKILYGDIYEAPLNENLVGRVRVGSADCAKRTSKTVNIHYVCEENSDNDLHIFAGLIQLNLELAYTAGNNLTVPFTIYAQPTSDGYAIIGAGDRSKKTLWDATTQAWVEVTENSTSGSGDNNGD